MNAGSKYNAYESGRFDTGRDHLTQSRIRVDDIVGLRAMKVCIQN